VTTGAVPPLAVSAPDGEETLSQFPAVNVDTSALNGDEPEPTLSTPNDCGGATPPSATAVNERPDCDNRIDSGLTLIVIVTGIVTGSGEVPVVITTFPL